MDSLPNTQPSTYVPEDISLNARSDNSWGQLIPSTLVKRTTSFIALTENSFTVGRSPNCNFVISSDNFIERESTKVSKQQFVLKRKLINHGTFANELTDLSSNGTYVNKKKIGKNKTRLLSNSDVIAVITPTLNLFVFMDYTNVDIPEQITNTYAIFGVLGKGGFGEVRLVAHKETSTKFAMKCISNGFDESKVCDVFMEIKILTAINHPYIIQAHDTIIINKKIYLILEFMPGGDLTDLVNVGARLSEDKVKYIFYQLVSAVSYLHSKKIIHRDLKPANILLSSKEDNYPRVKVTDFGLSKIMKHDITEVRTLCGTRSFAPPELLLPNVSRIYNTRADVWSLGVLLYLSLSGELPFTTRRTDLPFEEQISLAKYYFKPETIWRRISTDAKVIIRKSIVRNVQKRCTIDFIKDHPWFTNDEELLRRIDREISSPAPEDISNILIDEDMVETDYEDISVVGINEVEKDISVMEINKTDSDLYVKKNDRNDVHVLKKKENDIVTPKQFLPFRLEKDISVIEINKTDRDLYVKNNDKNDVHVLKKKENDVEYPLTPKRFCPCRT